MSGDPLNTPFCMCCRRVPATHYKMTPKGRQWRCNSCAAKTSDSFLKYLPPPNEFWRRKR